MVLSEIIIRRIKEEGPISFHDFMEMALYHPDGGYYTSVIESIGPSGDFYTGSNVTALYGEMIARQLEEMWGHTGGEKFTVVEYGAGTGRLCRDILGHLKCNEKLYSGLEYCIIEKSPLMRAREMAHLREKVRWYETIADIPDITGCVISNELLDNFAVHQVVMKDELMEVYVDHTEGFSEVLRPAPDELKSYFGEMGVQLPRDYRTEVNMEAIEWIGSIAGALKKGYVLTIDYGFHSDEMYKEYRCDGTLVCYNKHRVNYEPYQEIGRQDITSHVNFSSLYHWGAKSGLDCIGYTNQALFLQSLGIKEQLVKNLVDSARDLYTGYRQNAFIVQKLLMEMGNRFKVLIQQKGLPLLPLRGLKLACGQPKTGLNASYTF